MVELTCPLCCKETFTSPLTLKSHLLEVQQSLLCPLCKDNFPGLAELSTHLENCGSEGFEGSILAKALIEGSKTCKEEVVEEQSEYFCQSCNVHFTDFDVHLREHHEGQEIILEEEEVQEPPQEPLFVVINPAAQPPPAPPTLESVKDKDGRFYTRKIVKIDKFWLEESDKLPETVELTMCPTCDVYYPPSDASHENCSKNKKYNCDVCSTSFPTLKSVRLHRRMHEPIKARDVSQATNQDEEPREMFFCRICNKSYDKDYEEVHKSSHEVNNGFNCEVCNRKFHTKVNLEMHIKVHTNNKKFTCSYCKKPFVTYDSLNEHLTNQCQKRQYACRYCGRRFTRPHEKVKHERIHTGEKPHVCEICGKAFRVSYCLTLHMRTHSGARPYECSHCGKRFKSHSVYNHHLQTHSDVRAYKCPYCPKAFKTSVQLAGHKNSHIKPFTCTECNRPFASLYAVRAHMETHKRDNNLKYECWMCGALYSRAFGLRDHLKQQHQQGEGEKARVEAVGVEEELEAANSILVNEEDIILGLDGANIEIIENETG